MWQDLLTALGLMLVLEGLLPFVAPTRWREALLRLIQLADGQIRFFGLTLMVVGVLVLWLLRP